MVFSLYDFNRLTFIFECYIIKSFNREGMARVMSNFFQATQKSIASLK